MMMPDGITIDAGRREAAASVTIEQGAMLVSTRLDCNTVPLGSPMRDAKAFGESLWNDRTFTCRAWS